MALQGLPVFTQGVIKNAKLAEHLKINTTNTCEYTSSLKTHTSPHRC